MKTLEQLASTRNIPTSVAWSVADLAERRGKSVSLDLIRRVLKDLRPRVKCIARGKDAKWQKTTKW